MLDPNHVDPNFGFSYNQALDIDQNAGVNGIDAAIKQFQLDAVVSATDNPAWATDLIYGDHFIFGTSGLAAPPGYPIVQVPAGVVFGVPLGISFFGTAFSEPTLIKLALRYEAATQVRAHNLPTFPGDSPGHPYPRHNAQPAASSFLKKGSREEKATPDASRETGPSPQPSPPGRGSRVSGR